MSAPQTRAQFLHGKPIPEDPRYKPPASQLCIFDHLSNEPENALFSKVAHEMRRGKLMPGQEGPLAWWQTVPERDEPLPVAGEIRLRRKLRSA